jgi:hypothetical protein
MRHRKGGGVREDSVFMGFLLAPRIILAKNAELGGDTYMLGLKRKMTSATNSQRFIPT